MSDTHPISTLSEPSLKALKASILTEHFGWAPEAFAKQGMEVANMNMYAITDAVEQSLLLMTAKGGEGGGEEEGPRLEEEEVQRVSFVRSSRWRLFTFWEMIASRGGEALGGPGKGLERD